MSAIASPPSVIDLPAHERAADAYPVWHPMTQLATYLADPITIVGGEGSTVWDEDGTPYIAAAAGLWNVGVGYGRAEVREAIHAQVDRLCYGTLFRFGNQPAVDLARRLAEIAPPGLTRVFYSSSGAAAVEAAVKIARRHFFLIGQPQRRIVVALADGYHGTTIGAGALSGEQLGQEIDGVDRREIRHLPTPRRRCCPYCAAEPACRAECARPFVELVEREGDRIAAILLEPILGSAGVIPLPPELCEVVGALCRERGILLICDEVATGFGRTGRMWGSELVGLEPDLMTLSKGINAGALPLGATLVREDIFAALHGSGALFAHGETQAGNPLACAAAVATIDVIRRDGLVARAAAVGARLRRGLEELLALRHVSEVRGHGLMLGIELVGDPHRGTPLPDQEMWAVVRDCLRRGLIVHPAPSGLSLFPPLVLTGAEADRIAEILGDVLGRLYVP